MNKKVKLEIEIENNIIGIGRGRFDINDMLFTEFRNNEIQSDDIFKKVKSAIKRIDTFEMFTISVLVGDENDMYPPVIKSVRIIKKHWKTEIADWDGKSYSSWDNITDRKLNTILKKIVKEYCDLVNKEFKRLLFEIDNKISIERDRKIKDLGI
jgi:hypothetical protein